MTRRLLYVRSGGKPKMMGLVLWLPKERVDAAIAAEKAAKATPEPPHA